MEISRNAPTNYTELRDLCLLLKKYSKPLRNFGQSKKDELKHRLMSLWWLWENLTTNLVTTDPPFSAMMRLPVRP